jgi:hypothetical protein
MERLTSIPACTTAHGHQTRQAQAMIRMLLEACSRRDVLLRLLCPPISCRYSSTSGEAPSILDGFLFVGSYCCVSYRDGAKTVVTNSMCRITEEYSQYFNFKMPSEIRIPHNTSENSSTAKPLCRQHFQYCIGASRHAVGRNPAAVWTSTPALESQCDGAGRWGLCSVDGGREG